MRKKHRSLKGLKSIGKRYHVFHSILINNKKLDGYVQLNEKDIIETYSPCKTIISSISTFLFNALVRGAEAVRKRFVDASSGTAGLGFIFKTEDRLPTEVTTNSFQPQPCSRVKEKHCN